jgi:hypothetical protein
MFVVVSCVREQSKDESVKPNIEAEKECTITQDITPEENYIKPSQVIYHTRLKPEPLKNQQYTILSKFVDGTTLHKKDIWFVRVLYNRNNDLSAKIYFMPEVTSRRIRNGKYIHYGLTDWELEYAYALKGLKPEYCEYCQVSLKEKPFTAQAEIPPQNSMLPFAAPKDFSKQEIVEIVDFIRSAPKVKLETIFRLRWNLPIMTIIREEEVIKVITGTQEGGESGIGQFIMIRKTDEGYVVNEVVEWLS